MEKNILNANVSIITTSIDRKDELHRFFQSINRQKNIDLRSVQIIFVDQGDNSEIFNLLDDKIDKIIIKSDKCSLSSARNMAIPYVKNAIVAFGDDDCWYEDDCLSKVYKRIINDGFDGVIAKSLDERGNLNVPSPNKLTKLSVYNHPGAISYAIFLVFDKNLFFDENIGVGSPYGLSSGEETDYLIEYLRRHQGVYFDNNIVVFHPYCKSTYFNDYFEKTYRYSKGMGYLLKKQRYPFRIILRYIFRPLCGSVLYVIIGKTWYAKRSFCILKGRLAGLMYKLNSIV